MTTFDELLHMAYNSIEQEDGSWTYSEEKRTIKRSVNKVKLGKRILDRKRGRLQNDFQKEIR